MISKETNEPHQKHAKLSRPHLGSFGRNEIAISGTACATIKELAYRIIQQLSPLKLHYADADHKNGNNLEITNSKTLANGGYLEFTDKIHFQRIDFKNELNDFQKRTLFNDSDLIIVNGNHFSAEAQIVVIDPLKNLEKKAEQLTDVQLILLKEKHSPIPDFLLKKVDSKNVPILALDNHSEIIEFVKKFVSERTPPLNGLVLSGGLSSRMKKDKGNLVYYNLTQREYLFNLLSIECNQTFVSCNAKQASQIGAKLPIIRDAFLNLGPLGGILSALQTNPNAAWLTVACDLPYLSEKTISYLVQHRNPSKFATAFLDPQGEFPEPLITIWEPKSYPLLLQFLSQGYSCPRKALINSDIEILKAPNEKEFLNVNFKEEYERTLKDFKTTKTR